MGLERKKRTIMAVPKETPFNTHHGRYDAWFERNAAAYHSELLAIRALLPWEGLGLEIGVGTGRFAAPLGVKVGVDPSKNMLTYAIKRGVSSIQGVAEALAFRDAVFDYGLVVTTICFVDDPEVMLREAQQVLKPGGYLIIGFVDRTSILGRHYLKHQAESVFYRKAMFYSALEVEKLLADSGFVNQAWKQTLSKPLNEIKEIEPLREGYGHGEFVVVRVTKCFDSQIQLRILRARIINNAHSAQSPE